MESIIEYDISGYIVNIKHLCKQKKYRTNTDQLFLFNLEDEKGQQYRFKFTYDSNNNVDVRDYDFVTLVFKDEGNSKGFNKSVIHFKSINSKKYEKKILFILKKIFTTTTRANNIYSQMLEIHSGSVLGLLDSLVEKCYSSYISRKILDNIYNFIPDEKLYQLYEYCYKEFIIRVLEQLGISEESIKESGFTPYEVLNLCKKNPYALFFIDEEKISNIIEYFHVPINTDYNFLGQVGKSIYKILKFEKSSCITRDKARLIIDSFDQEFEKLCKEFYITETKYGDIALRPIYNRECKLSSFFAGLLMNNYSYNQEEMSEGEFISDIDLKFTDGITEEQKQAVIKSFKHKISIITGGPGTGKSTIIKEIINNYERNGINYLVCAYVGKAVSNIRDKAKTGLIKTIHSAIADNEIKNNKSLRIVIDEISMVTIDLFLMLIEKFEQCSHFTLIGDINQLPPQSWGELMRELIDTKLIPTSILTHNFRVKLSNKENFILKNIEEFKNAEPTSAFEFIPGWNFMIEESEDSFDIFNIIEKLHEIGTKRNIDVKVEPKKIGNFDNQTVQSEYDVNTLTIITPFNKCNGEINLFCQKLHNENKIHIQEQNSSRLWYLGDRVMMTINIKCPELFNGDEGIISDINTHHNYISVKFKNGKTEKFFTSAKEFHNYKRLILQNKDEVSEMLTTRMLTLSYALTVDKSQGSSWEWIIFHIPSECNNFGFIDKKRVYTAITRAEKYCILHGNIKIMEGSITNNYRKKKENTSRLIQDYFEEFKYSENKNMVTLTEAFNMLKDVPDRKINRMAYIKFD